MTSSSKSVVSSDDRPRVLVDVDKILDISNIRSEPIEEVPDSDELLQSIKLHGVLQPLCVCEHPEGWQLLTGRRRFDRVRKLGIKQVDVKILPIPEDQAALEIIQLQENIQRLDMEPVRTGEVLLGIKNARGITNEELSKQVSLNSIKVSRWIRLGQLHQDIKNFVQRGLLGVTKALELGALPEAEWRVLLPNAVSGAITRDELIHQRKSREPKNAPSNRQTSRVTAALGEGKTVTVSGQGLDLSIFIEMLEDLLARARKVRPSGMALKTFIKLIQDQTMPSKSDTSSAP